METVSHSKAYFWPYDLFGYLLPGLFILLVLDLTNTNISDQLLFLLASNQWINIISFFSIAYIIGHITSSISKIVLEKFILQIFVKYPSYHLFNPEQYRNSWPKKLIIPGYFISFSKHFRRNFHTKFKDTFNMSDFDKLDTYWMVWVYVMGRYPLAYKRSIHFIELYGFARNISMCFLLIIFFPFIPGWKYDFAYIIWIIPNIIFAIIMFINFAKLLYRQSNELFRSFLVCSED